MTDDWRTRYVAIRSQRASAILPERYVRFQIRDVKQAIDDLKSNPFEKSRRKEYREWLKALKEYYKLNHGDIKKNAKISDEALMKEAAMKILRRMSK